MKVLKKVLIIFGAIIVLLIIIAFILPSKVKIERSLTMKTTKPVVYEQVNNMKKWEKWSPWHRMDTAMQITYGDTIFGTGAWYSWTSENSNLGNGKMLITNSHPNDSIITDLIFEGEKPSVGKYFFEKVEDSVKVTWTMEWETGYNPVNRWMGLLMKGFIGGTFEQGLANLDSVCQVYAKYAAKSGDVAVELADQKQQPYIYIRDTCTMATISGKLGQIYGELQKFINEKGLQMAGAPFAIYHNPDTSMIMDVEAGFPVDKAVQPAGRIKAGEFKAGKIAVAEHVGSFNTVADTYTGIMNWISKNGKQIAGPPSEHYLTDPSVETDTSKWITKIVFPVK